MARSIETVIADLVRNLKILDERDPLFELDLVAGKPVTAAALARYEKHLGRPLPPSYRAFLALHDGCRGLTLFGNMLSIADVMPKGKRYRDIESWRKAEAKPDAIVIGDRDDQSDLVYLDPARPGKGGELRVVVWDHEDDERELPDLVAYLEECLAACKEWIADVPKKLEERARAEKERAEARARETAAANALEDRAKTRAIPAGEIRALPSLEDYEVRHVAFSPDGTLLASTTSYGKPRVWDVASGTLAMTLEDASSVGSIDVGKTGHIAMAMENEIRILDRDGKVVSSTKRKCWSNAVFGPTGKWLLAASAKKTLSVWEAPAWKARALPAFKSDPCSLAVGGSHVAFYENNSKRLHLWNAKDLVSEQVIEAPAKVWIVALDPAGTVLAASLGKEVWLWDIAAKRELGKVAPESWLQAIVLTAGRLFTAGSGVVEEWDVRTLARLDRRAGSTMNMSLAVSRDSALLAEGGKGIVLRTL